MQLPDRAFARADEHPDHEFYRQPRLVHHLDGAALAEVTDLYREFLPVGGWILDLMSSWVSHLPPEVEYARVEGLGMNAAELAANARLDAHVVHDLNANPRLPYPDRHFDAATICVSIDYLTRPVAVLQDLGRVLMDQSPLVITFSNRCFPTKAVAIWHALSDEGRLQLVMDYLREAGNWERVMPFASDPHRPGDPLYAVVAYNIASIPTPA